MRDIVVLGQNPVVMNVDDNGKGGDRCFWRTKKDASSTREVEDVEARALTMIVPDTDYIYQCLALKKQTFSLLFPCKHKRDIVFDGAPKLQWFEKSKFPQSPCKIR